MSSYMKANTVKAKMVFSLDSLPTWSILSRGVTWDSHRRDSHRHSKQAILTLWRLHILSISALKIFQIYIFFWKKYYVLQASAFSNRHLLHSKEASINEMYTWNGNISHEIDRNKYITSFQSWCTKIYSTNPAPC